MRYGNTTAASIPIALSEAMSEGRIKPNDNILLAAFGSGFTWEAHLLSGNTNPDIVNNTKLIIPFTAIIE